MNARKIRNTEIILISLLWVVLLVVPVLFREDYNNSIWRSITTQLEIIIPVAILFALNRVLYVPLFLFRYKPTLYILAFAATLALLAAGSDYYDRHISLPGNNPQRREMTGNPPPRQDEPQRPGEPREPNGPPMQQQPVRQPRPVPPYVNVIIFSILVVGFDTGLRSGLRWIEAENEKVNLEKEKVAAQLNYLQNQVSPHFFMNTLNNIHSLVDKDTEEAKSAIITLSKMMRYLLYETGSSETTIRKEMEFLESYVNLMKLRYIKNVRISLNLPSVVPDKKIPPFLFLSLIENAFKHGISYKEESFVDIDVVAGENRMLLTVSNSKSNQARDKAHSGIGIENTRKRLDLLFGTRYHLDVIDSENNFTVNLSIPV